MSCTAGWGARARTHVCASNQEETERKTMSERREVKNGEIIIARRAE